MRLNGTINAGWIKGRRVGALLLAMTSALSAAPTPNPTSPPVLSQLEERSPYSVTVLSNPARGKKATFRVRADRAVKVRVRIYDRFLDKVTDLEKEGDKFFDILWPLQKVPEGIYYFQAQIIDPTTLAVTPLALEKFLVLKTPAARKD